MKYETRPISDRTPFTGVHEYSPFRASWQDTLDLLGRELDALKATDAVIEVDVVNSGHIRADGMLRADAKVTSPAVRIAFNSVHGALTYATDRYTARYRNDPDDWKQNVRAIALGLEALRKVDRYGITKRGEQYTGWLQIEAGPAIAIASHMTKQAAADLLERLAIGDDPAQASVTVERVLADPARPLARQILRSARFQAHPDRNDGDRTLWDQVEQAAKVLGIAS